MSRYPGIEAGILAALREGEEVRPPQSRLAQEYFWLAASYLQSRGLCVADQATGVVRRVAPARPLLQATLDTAPISASDLPARLRLLVGRWRQMAVAPWTASITTAFEQCAIDLEEVVLETGGEPKEDEMSSNGYEAEREQLLHDGRECEEEAESVRRAIKAGFYHGSGEIDPVGAKLAAQEAMVNGLTDELLHRVIESTPQELQVENLTDKPVQYRVLAPVDGSPLDELEASLAAEDGGRFGDRLRRFAHHEQGHTFVREACDQIADAIDQDAARILGERDIFAAGLIGALNLDREAIDRSGEPVGNAILRAVPGATRVRQQVEEAVERLRYSVTTWEGESIVPDTRNQRDVIHVASLQAELDRIFGARAGEENKHVR